MICPRKVVVWGAVRVTREPVGAMFQINSSGQAFQQSNLGLLLSTLTGRIFTAYLPLKLTLALFVAASTGTGACKMITLVKRIRARRGEIIIRSPSSHIGIDL